MNWQVIRRSENFANAEIVGHTHQAKKVAMMNPS